MSEKSGNKSAIRVAQQLRELGCVVFAKGWPDLLVLHGSSVFAVEVKFGCDKPSQEQEQVAEVLWRINLPVWEVHDVVTSAMVDRLQEQRLREDGRSAILMIDTLLQAVVHRGEQPIAEHLFKERSKFRLARCNCGCDVIVEEARLA